MPGTSAYANQHRNFLNQIIQNICILPYRILFLVFYFGYLINEFHEHHLSSNYYAMNYNNRKYNIYYSVFFVLAMYFFIAKKTYS